MGAKGSKKADLPGGHGTSQGAVLPPPNNFKPVTNLREHLRRNKPEEEFKAIEYLDTMNGTLGAGSTAEAFKDANKPKNRYGSVVPYDQTRVKLKGGAEDSDYINASHVEGEDISYICAQGPLPETTPDFWKMVWDENVHIILMLTKTIENGRIKCHRYYPEKDEPEANWVFGNYRLEPSVFDENEETGITVRTYKMTMTNIENSPVKEVTHFQYLGWPDHGVPSNTEGIRDLIQRIEKIVDDKKAQSSPIVVHCSAGIGRTGTFCTIHIALRRIRKHLAANPGTAYKFDIYNMVLELRKQRTGMVQQPEQYRFCYEAIMDGAIKLGVDFPEKRRKSSKKQDKDDSKTKKNALQATSSSSSSVADSLSGSSSPVPE